MPARLLILDNTVRRFLLRLPRHWTPYLEGVDVEVVNVPSGRPIPPPGDYTHLLLTGSETSILEPRPWFDREADAVREAAERDLSILGSCFGHQMLVYALSGPAHLARSPVPEVGWIGIERLADDELLADAPSPWHTFSSHFDEVVDPPSPWRVLARSKDCAVQAIRYGERPIWGLQPHPELPLAKARLFLSLYLLLSKRERRRLILAMRKPSHEDRIADRIVSRFLASGRGD